MQTKTVFQLQTPAQFALYLRSLRRLRGLTQRDLGQRIGVTGARISEIEKDPGAVGLAQLLKLLHMLGARAILTLDEGRSRANARHSAPTGEW